MPPVTRRHQRPSRYAEGEHEPSRPTRRNRPAYAVVVPMTHRYTTDIGDRRCAQIASRYLEARSDERCLNGLPTEPAVWLCLRRRKRACSTTTTSGLSTSLIHISEPTRQAEISYAV